MPSPSSQPMNSIIFLMTASSTNRNTGDTSYVYLNKNKRNMFGIKITELCHSIMSKLDRGFLYLSLTYQKLIAIKSKTLN